MSKIPVDDRSTEIRSETECVFPRAQACGAKTRTGGQCRLPAELNEKTGLRKRCRRHGGKSTGPRKPTAKHGRYSKAYLEAKRAAREQLEVFREKAAALGIPEVVE